jgi:hypothetical protein
MDKKQIITITALISIIFSTITIQSMENRTTDSVVPPEVVEIIMAYVEAYNEDGLPTYDNADAIIKAIKSISLVNTNFNTIINDMYGNTEGFKKIVQLIHNKTRVSTEEIADKFGTPAAKRYLELVKQATNLFGDTDKINKIKALINDGLDVNFTYKWAGDGTLFKQILRHAEPEIVKAFLDAGVKIECQFELRDLVNYLELTTERSYKVYKIKDLLKNACKK